MRADLQGVSPYKIQVSINQKQQRQIMAEIRGARRTCAIKGIHTRSARQIYAVWGLMLCKSA